MRSRAGKDLATPGQTLPLGTLRHPTADDVFGEETGLAPAAFVVMAAITVLLTGGFLTAFMARF